MVALTKRTNLFDDHTAGDYNLLIDAVQQLPGPGGFLINGKIVVTVSSNDLIVAIKTLAGADPSVADPVACRIGNTVRLITAALSVTKIDGTNWAGLGGAMFGGVEQDLFVYLVWNTNLGTPAVDIFWSRKPNGNLYSHFSGTTTNEGYAAINATAPAATDECVNIGRFAATLSLAGTSHLWTVPSFTNDNLIQRPIFRTRLLTFTPQPSNVSGNGTWVGRYQFREDRVRYEYEFVYGTTSNITGDPTILVPFTPSLISSVAPPVGLAKLVVAGTNYSGVSLINATTIFVRIQLISGTYLAQANVSNTLPAAWATGNSFDANGEYWY